MRYVSSSLSSLSTFLFFFFNDTATTEIYTLSLHDALPIYSTPWTTLKIAALAPIPSPRVSSATRVKPGLLARVRSPRSEEHTSELQSRLHLVCRLLLEKKKTTKNNTHLLIMCTHTDPTVCS